MNKLDFLIKLIESTKQKVITIRNEIIKLIENNNNLVQISRNELKSFNYNEGTIFINSLNEIFYYLHFEYCIDYPIRTIQLNFAEISTIKPSFSEELYFIKDLPNHKKNITHIYQDGITYHITD